MKERIITGLVGIVAISILIYLGEMAVLAFLVLAGTIATYEYGTVIYGNDKKVSLSILTRVLFLCTNSFC